MITTVEKLYQVMTKPLVAIAYLGLIFISFMFWDKPIAEYFFSLHLEQGYPWLLMVTKLAWGGFIIPGLLLLALALRFVFNNDKWRQAFFVWLCIVVPSLVALVFKISLARARPTLWLGQEIYGFQWLKLKASYWSFPSGHTINFMGLMFGLSILYPRYFMPLMLIGVVVISTRVLLIAHYLSDVMMAMYLSLVIIGMMQQWLQNRFAWGQALWRTNEQAI